MPEDNGYKAAHEMKPVELAGEDIKTLHKILDMGPKKLERLEKFLDLDLDPDILMEEQNRIRNLNTAKKWLRNIGIVLVGTVAVWQAWEWLQGKINALF